MAAKVGSAAQGAKVAPLVEAVSIRRVGPEAMAGLDSVASGGLGRAGSAQSPSPASAAEGRAVVAPTEAECLAEIRAALVGSVAQAATEARTVGAVDSAVTLGVVVVRAAAVLAVAAGVVEHVVVKEAAKAEVAP